MSNVSYEEMHVRPGLAPRRLSRIRWIKGIAWTSVFAGVAVALGVQVLLNMLGTGIGMSTIDPLRAEGTPSISTFGIGAGLWWVVSSFIALVIGGWVAAQFSGYLRHLDGLLHGLLVWALTTLITIFLLGGAIGWAMSGVGTVLGTGAGGMVETASLAVSLDDIKEDARTLLSRQQPAGSRRTVDPVTGLVIPSRTQQPIMDPELNLALERFLTAEDPAVKESNRTALINLLLTRSDIGIDEATNRVNSWERSYEQAERKALVAADRIARAVSWSALWGFLAILLGAVAGALGGFVGTASPDAPIREERPAA